MTALSRILRRYLRAGDIYLDLGARNGVASALTAASIVGRTGLVVAVEADAPCYRRLCENVRHNDISNVRCLHMPVAGRQWRLDRVMHAAGLHRVDMVRINMPALAEQIVRGMGELLTTDDAPSVIWPAGEEEEGASLLEDVLLAADFCLSSAPPIKVAVSPRMAGQQAGSTALPTSLWPWIRSTGRRAAACASYNAALAP